MHAGQTRQLPTHAILPLYPPHTDTHTQSYPSTPPHTFPHSGNPTPHHHTHLQHFSWHVWRGPCILTYACTQPRLVFGGGDHTKSMAASRWKRSNHGKKIHFKLSAFKNGGNVGLSQRTLKPFLPLLSLTHKNCIKLHGSNHHRSQPRIFYT